MSVNEVKFRLSVDGAAQVRSDLTGVESSLDKIGAGVQRLGHYGVALIGLQSLQGAAAAFLRTSDAVTQLNNQLRLASGSAAEASSAYSRLFAIAQQSRLSFTELGGTYARIARSTSELGISQGRLLIITKAIGDAVAISGASAESANNALVQFGQGMAAGALRGDELNSVMEQVPPLARAIADGLGVTIGELRKLGEAGELSAQKVLGALESQSGVLGKEAAESTKTFSQAVTQLGNSLELLIGQLEKTTHASSGMGSVLDVFSRGVQAVAESMAMAERRGDGWFRQVNDGLGMLIGRTLGLQLLSRDFMTLQGAVDDARATLAKLDAQERRDGQLGIYAMQRRADAMRDLARASRELAAMGPDAGSRSVGSGDAALARAQAADQARRQKLADAAWEKYATPSEKLGAELKRVSDALGDLYTPELAQRITESFIKPTAAAKNEAAQFADALGGQARSLREQLIEATSGAAASLEFQAAQLGVSGQTAAVRAEIERLSGALKAHKAAAEEAAKAAEAMARAQGEWQKQTAERQQLIQSLRDELLGLRDGRDAVRELEIARADEAAVMAERQALAVYAATGDADELRRMQAVAKQLREVAQLRRQIRDAEAQGEARKANEQMLAEWERTTEQMGQSLSDALMNGGKSAAGYLKDLFRTVVLRPILMPAATSMSAFAAGPATAGGAGGGIGNALSLGGSLLGGLGTFGSAAGVGLGATLGGAGLGGTLAGAGAMIGQGTMAGLAGGLGLGIGAIAPYALAAVAAYALAKKAFSRKLADTGIEGEFSAAGDFSGSSYAFYKGGWLRKDKTTRGTLDAGVESALDAGAKAASATVREYARVLGLPVKALDGYSQKLKLSLRGLSDDQVQAAIAQAVADFGSGMAKVYELPLSQFQRAGEGLADTLARLAGLQTFSDTIADLGGVFARVAGLGVDAREAFIAMAGGMDTLLANAQGFVQEYYSRDEIAGIKAAELKDALAAVGITQDVNSRGEFRALVDSLDVSSQAGQEQLAALLGMAQAFTQVADYMAETGGTLAGTAALAPAGGAGAALFAPGGQGDQLLAINNVGFWTEAVFNAVKQLTSVVQGGTGSAAPVPVPAPEVNAGWIGVSGGGG